MSDFITLACPCCGGNLALTADAERFACPYCRREHLVRRSGGHVSLIPIIEKLERVEQKVEQHASELAIYRLQAERQTVTEQIERRRYEMGNWRKLLAKAQTDFMMNHDLSSSRPDSRSSRYVPR